MAGMPSRFKFGADSNQAPLGAIRPAAIPQVVHYNIGTASASPALSTASTPSWVMMPYSAVQNVDVQGPLGSQHDVAAGPPEMLGP